MDRRGFCKLAGGLLAAIGLGKLPKVGVPIEEAPMISVSHDDIKDEMWAGDWYPDNHLHEIMECKCTNGGWGEIGHTHLLGVTAMVGESASYGGDTYWCEGMRRHG